MAAEDTIMEEIIIEENTTEESGIRNIKVRRPRKLMEEIQQKFKESAVSGETPPSFSNEFYMRQIDKIRPYRVIINTLENFFPEVFDCFDVDWTINEFFDDLEDNELKISGLQKKSKLFFDNLSEKVAGELEANGVPNEYYADRTALKKRLLGKLFAKEKQSEAQNLFLEVYAPGLGFSLEQINSFLGRIFKRGNLYPYNYQEFILYIVSRSIESHIEVEAEREYGSLPWKRNSADSLQEIISQSRRPMHDSLSAYKVYKELITYYEKLKADIKGKPEQWKVNPADELKSTEEIMNAADSTIREIRDSNRKTLFEGEVCREDTIHPILQELLVRFVKCVRSKANTEDIFCGMMNYVLHIYSKKILEFKKSYLDMDNETRDKINGIGTIQIRYSSEKELKLEDGMEFYYYIKGKKTKVVFSLMNGVKLPPASEGTAALKVECTDITKTVPIVYAAKEDKDYGHIKFILSYSSNSEIVLKEGTLIQSRRKGGQDKWMNFSIKKDIILPASKDGKQEIPVICKNVKPREFNDLPEEEIELAPAGNIWNTDCKEITEAKNENAIIYQKWVDPKSKDKEEKEEEEKESTIIVSIQSCEEYKVEESAEKTPGFVKRAGKEKEKYDGQQWSTKKEIKGIHCSGTPSRQRISVHEDITFDEQKIREGGNARAKGTLSIKCAPGTIIPKGTIFSRRDPERKATFNYEATEYTAAMIFKDFRNYFYKWPDKGIVDSLEIGREMLGEWFASTEIKYKHSKKLGSTLPNYNKDYVQLKNHFMTLVFLIFVEKKVTVGEKTPKERKELRAKFKEKVKEVLTSVTSPLPEFYEGNKYEWLLMYLVGRENPIEDFRCLWAIEKERQREILDEKKRTSAKNKAASK